MKYLIYCGPGIGDFVIILPAAKVIKENDKEAFISLLIASNNSRVKIIQQMIELQKYIDEVNYYSVKELKHSVNLIHKLGHKKFDVGLVLQYTANKKTSSWPYYIVKYVAKLSGGITNPHKVRKYDIPIEFKKGYHVMDYPLLMLEEMGYKGIDASFDEGFFNKKELSRYIPWENVPIRDNRKTIALCVGTAEISMEINGTRMFSDNKKWSYENWINLSNQLSQKYNVILLGGKKEHEDMQNCMIKLEPNIIDMAGICSIKESMSLLTISDLIIGADTGLMHCAGAMNVPSLTLFGCTDFNEYKPYGSKSAILTANMPCSPCFGTEKSVLCEEKECMSKITLNMVMDKVGEIINANRFD